MIIVVFPTWAELITDTSVTSGSVMASMIAFWYGIVSVENLPASLDPSGKTIYLSAHSLIVMLSFGLSRSASLLMNCSVCQLTSLFPILISIHSQRTDILSRYLDVFVRIKVRRTVACQLHKRIVYVRFQDPLDLRPGLSLQLLCQF